jgi:hypothetical protein
MLQMYALSNTFTSFDIDYAQQLQTVQLAQHYVLLFQYPNSSIFRPLHSDCQHKLTWQKHTNQAKCKNAAPIRIASSDRQASPELVNHAKHMLLIQVIFVIPF